MKWYMKNVHTFKNYFTQSNQPHSFREYVQSLDEYKLNQFYNQMKEPVEFITDESYLLYKFQWLEDSEDLSKEFFLQAVMSCEDHLIKDKWFSILHQRYEKDIQELLEDFSS